ncbi:efflux RND transporter periplasmic adaptor subunit [candidate division WOR-3 bacterium]|nr:efflux RND transporter periplasmic adaptor subunit [candidate division WOR-3 bacterium]
MKRYFLLLFTVSCFLSCTQDKDLDVAQNDPKKIMIAVAVNSESVLSVKFSQNISPRRESRLSPAMPGRVEMILVEKGDSVQKGQLLVVLSGEMLTQAQAQFEAAKSDYLRAQNLYENSAISLQQLEKAEALFKSAAAQRDMATRSAYVYAPFKGIITDVSCEEGEIFSFTPEISLSSVEGSGIVTLSAIDSVEITGNVPERYYTKMRKGLEAVIKPDLYSDTAWTGLVSNVGSVIDVSTRTFEVEIVLENPGKILKPGMYAEVSIITDRLISTRIPEEALVTDVAGNGYYVFVVENGKAFQRSVEVSLIENGFVEVLSGLDSGDTVATVGSRTLADKDEVSVIREK